MLLDQKNKSSLQKFRFDNEGSDAAMPDTDDSLAEAMELLYQVLNQSYATSGTPLEVDENGQRQSVQGLYWRCKELLEQVGNNPEKTGFLAMSVLEHTWELARGLVLCPVSDMLDGDMSMLENAKKLEAILRDNPYKQIWAERAGAYVAILEKIGFRPEPGAFSDLTRIMDPLLDALSFYDAKKFQGKPGIYLVRDGRPSESRSPMIARAMCRYSSKKGLVDAVMGSGRDCMMAFGAIESTHAQVKDYFTEWFNGFPEERQRNMMRNEHLTDEEYLAAPCDYTRAIYLCVKSGQRCWLVHMPWKGDYYSKIGDKDHAYYYGKRASYAPYQIFFEDAAPAPEGSTMLAVPITGYLLSDLMDPMAMAWYPAFLDETMKIFFGKGRPVPDVERLILPEEIAADMPSRDGKAPERHAVVPVYSGVPAVSTWTYEIRPPEEVFAGDPNALELIRHFGITADYIENVPILPERPGNEKAMRGAADERLRKAYIKAVTDSVADLMEGRWAARRWIVDKVLANLDDILEQAGSGDLMPFMSVHLDNIPVMNPDGTPKMVKRAKYPWDEVPAMSHTDIDDGREEVSRRYGTFTRLVRWITKPTSGRPPVVWKIEPKDAGQYALLAGCAVSDLPEILQMSGQMSKFYEDYHGAMPYGMDNKYTALGYGEGRKSAYIPCFCRINICMTKKAYKAFDYFKE